MSFGQSDEMVTQRLCLHPSVGPWVNPEVMTPRQRVAAVAKVRCLEHDLFEGDRVRRELSREEADGIVAKINELRLALGWLEIDLKGHFRWPQLVGCDRQAGHVEPAEVVVAGP